jgi:hypothetical protein
MKKHLLLIIFLVLFPAFVYNQDDQIVNDPDQMVVSGVNKNADNEKPALKDRFNTHFQVGTSFSYSPGNFYGPSYFVSPSVSYQVSPRFMLSAGAGLEYSTLYPLYKQTEGDNKMLPMTRAYLYARGSYFITPRLIVSGTVYENMMDAPRLTNNSMPVKYNYQGMSIGIQYNVSRSFSFGFEMHMRNSNFRPDGLIPASGYVPVPGF